MIAFPLLAEAFFQQGQAVSPADLGSVLKLFKVAGGFSMAVSLRASSFSSRPSQH